MCGITGLFDTRGRRDIDRAVAAYPDPDAIIERNIAAMQALGVDGFRKLLSEHD